jgi:hypothetical protein
VIRIQADTITDVLQLIVSEIDPEARQIDWYLLRIEGVTDGDVLGRGVLKLEEEVRQSPTGVHLDWSQVQSLADTFTDVWFIRLVGTTSVPALGSAALLEELAMHFDFAIDRFDSGDWLVHCRRPVVCSRLIAALRAFNLSVTDEGECVGAQGVN